MHDILFYATLYLGEGGTMASEAALLGTPAVYVSSLSGTMGNFIELEETFDLLYSFSDGEEAVVRAKQILRDPASKENWRKKRARMLNEKIDTTAFMIWFVENYPDSQAEMKRRRDLRGRSASMSNGV